ncbi:MAG: glycosyltransferase family 4 protein [Gammaproteobacteria bacterium]|jgi:glycosyltransferase involved in cell wall biosynthesis
MSSRLHVLALAPYCDGLDVGEAWCAHQWIANLSRYARVTLLTLRRDGQVPASRQLPNVEVVEWDERLGSQRFSRLSSMLKPSYLGFYIEARRWIASALSRGMKFDIAHQFTPIALRYPTPLAEFQIPYVIGPLGGSLDTPPGFAAECRSSAWYTHLRRLDHWRLRRDPTLRRSYARAAAVLGVAPYVGELLQHASPRRFEVISELGIDRLAPARHPSGTGTVLRLVHVGRAVRTKGLRDAVRALARLPDDVSVHLDVAGQGEELPTCKELARSLGVADRITFHGQVSRETVETLYSTADAFLFPSFREPSGSVVFEALRHGLPVITTDRGGPGFVVDQSCGIRVPAVDPDQLAADLADAITRLARDPGLMLRYAEGARERIASIGLWDNKIQWLLDLYSQVFGSSHCHDLKEVI